MATFSAIKATERPIEGKHSRINSVLRSQPRSSLAFISNELRFSMMASALAAEPLLLQDARPKLFLVEKMLGFRREILLILDLKLTADLAAMPERELSNLLYRDSLKTKHAVHRQLAERLESGKKEDTRPVAAVTACNLCQILVAHMIQAPWFHFICGPMNYWLILILTDYWLLTTTDCWLPPPPPLLLLLPPLLLLLLPLLLLLLLYYYYY